MEHRQGDCRMSDEYYDPQDYYRDNHQAQCAVDDCEKVFTIVGWDLGEKCYCEEHRHSDGDCYLTPKEKEPIIVNGRRYCDAECAANAGEYSTKEE